MERLKEIVESRKFTWFLLAMGALVILVYYVRKVPMIYAVWELMDEFGYLADAAYLSGNKWPFVTNFYYGYGYSLWLIPLFWIFDSGIAIIRGAIVINVLMTVALFFVQYALLSKVCKDVNRNMLVVCSFVLCFYPYIVASELKVICEVLVTLTIWLCGLLFYQALDTKKWYYFILMSLCAVYSFFVHTRSFVFGGVLVGTMLLLFLFRSINWKQLLIASVTAVVALVIGFGIKNQVIQNVYIKETAQAVQESLQATVEAYTGDCMVASAAEQGTVAGAVAEGAEQQNAGVQNAEVQNIDVQNAEQQNAEVQSIEAQSMEAQSMAVQSVGAQVPAAEEAHVVNTLPLAYIWERIMSVFTNFSVMYLYGFACRNFYLFAGTGGMFHIGLFVALKDVFTEWKESKKIGAASGVKFLFAAASIMAVLATTVQAPYFLDKPAYNFYGRYYDYIIGPLAFIGLAYCIKKKIPLAAKVLWAAVFGISLWGTLDLAQYLQVHDIYFDSFRLAALSYFTYPEHYSGMVQEAAKALLLVMGAVLLLNYGKKTRNLIPVVIMLLFMCNNRVIIDNILDIQSKNTDDLGMAAYIEENYDKDEIYFLNSGFPYPNAYADLQPLMPKKPLIVLEGEECLTLKEGDIFLSFHNNPYLAFIEQSIVNIYSTDYYDAYIVEQSDVIKVKE